MYTPVPSRYERSDSVAGLIRSIDNPALFLVLSPERSALSLLKQEGYIFADRRSGARVRKEFAVTKELSEKSKELLQQIISEAKVSGMTKEEFFEICGKLYE